MDQPTPATARQRKVIKLRLAPALLAQATNTAPPRAIAPNLTIKAERLKTEPAAAATPIAPKLPKIKIKTSGFASAASPPPPPPPQQQQRPPPPQTIAPASAPTGPPPKPFKIKFKPTKVLGQPTPVTPKTPTLKITNHAHRPTHRQGASSRPLPLGLGYDSEASDREDDPALEEQFILRMQPGEDCDYLREAIENKTMGRETDVWIKFKDNRRAVVAVRGRMYAATLVDLPCIIESSKTLDKKTIFKTADICQMLLVGDPIIIEDMVSSNINIDTVYPHGITPPLTNVRRQRFRKRISRSTIEAVEKEVDALIAADLASQHVRYELFDPNNEFATTTFEEDAEGEEVDYVDGMFDGDGEGDEEMEDLDADGEADEDMDEDEEVEEEEEEEDFDFNDAFEEHEASNINNMDIDPTLTHSYPPVGHKGPASSYAHPAPTPAQQSDSESDEDDDDDEDEDEAAKNRQKIREEIKDIEEQMRQKRKQLAGAGNVIVKQRIQSLINNMTAEAEMKRVQLEE